MSKATFIKESNKYVTGTGQDLRGIHEEDEDCRKYGCVIHNPTDPHSDWPTHWRPDRQIMERLCSHGIGHPDLDDLKFHARLGQDIGIHGCDGCCGID